MRRLLIRPGAIGDLIVSLPALESLRAEYTEVWVAEQNVPLVQFADAVRSIGSTGLDLLEIDPPAGLVERLRGFDSIISWYGSNRVEFRDAAARLGLNVQFFTALPSDARVHASDFYLGQVGDPLGRLQSKPRSDGCQPAPRIPSCPTSDSFAIIHPFASSSRKRWPMEKFQQTAQLLRMPVRWCAGPQEVVTGAVRIDNLYELGRWISQGRVYIGNDSGISHLAAHVGTPTIVLFGPTDPAVWAPRGSRVLYPMDSIEPADVAAAVEAL
jgi:heptosyltransferase-3